MTDSWCQMNAKWEMNPLPPLQAMLSPQAPALFLGTPVWGCAGIPTAGAEVGHCFAFLQTRGIQKQSLESQREGKISRKQENAGFPAEGTPVLVLLVFGGAEMCTCGSFAGRFEAYPRSRSALEGDDVKFTAVHESPASSCAGSSGRALGGVSSPCSALLPAGHGSCPRAAGASAFLHPRAMSCPEPVLLECQPISTEIPNDATGVSEISIDFQPTWSSVKINK